MCGRMFELLGFMKTGQKRTKLSCALLRRRCASRPISSNFFPWPCALSSSSQIRSSTNLLSSFNARSIKEKRTTKNSKYARCAIPFLCNGGCNTSYSTSQIRLASYILTRNAVKLTLPRRACHSHPEKPWFRFTDTQNLQPTENRRVARTRRTKLAKRWCRSSPNTSTTGGSQQSFSGKPLPFQSNEWVTQCTHGLCGRSHNRWRMEWERRSGDETRLWWTLKRERKCVTKAMWNQCIDPF